MSNQHLRRSLALSLGLFLLSIYLLSYRGGFHSVDEVSIFAVTESIAKFGQVNTDQIAWTQWTTSQAEAQGFFGRDGRVYSKKGLALSLAQVPLYLLALYLPGIGMLQTVSLLNALVTAATGLLLFMFIWRLGYSPQTAVLTALIYGLATIAFVYAKYLFSEPLAGFLLLLAAYMLFTYRQEGGVRHVAVAGLAAGFAVLTRANNLFLLPAFGLYLLWSTTRRHEARNGPGLALTWRGSSLTLGHTRFSIPHLPWITFTLALATTGLSLMFYNTARSGSPFQTGYDLTLFSSNALLGLYKLLFSPLRGLFIYSPILVMSLPGWWLFNRRHPAEAWLLAGCSGLTVALFAFWSSGEGLSWGSRFLVPIVPFLAVALAPLIETLGPAGWTSASAAPSAPDHNRNPLVVRPVALLVAFFFLLLLSFVIQLLGITINPWVFLARLQAQFGGEFFLENTVALYDFRASQIAGQIQAWSLENSDLAWLRWGFDPVAFGLSFGLVLLTGWLLWPAVADKRSRPLLPTVVVLLLTVIITFALLSRYYRTDRQFGPPEDGYTRALESAGSRALPGQPIITVAQYHYHLPMNRFRRKVPLLGFAQQRWPPPAAALPLLESAAGQDVWLVTIGFPPAAADNAAEQWLVRHTFKSSDEWFDDSVRLAHFTATQPTVTRPIETRLGEEQIELIEVRLRETIAAGHSLPVELVWRPAQRPQADYNLFLQLLSGDGALVAQHDSPPNGGYSPTSTWQPATDLIARHALALPPDLAPGDYRLIAGLYRPTTGRRLLVNGSADFVELGNVTIIPGLGGME